MRIEVRLQREQSFQGRVRAVAFVAIATDFARSDLFSGLLIENRHGDLHWRDLAGKKALLLRACGPLLTGERVFVLCFTADVVALRDHLGCFTHLHVESGLLLQENGMWIRVALNKTDALEPAADRRIGS